MADINFEQLIINSQKGDNTAYAKLLRASESRIRSFIAKKINDQQDVEDIVQEVLISIHKSRQTYQKGNPYLPWMYAITRYRLMDYLRSKYKQKEHEVISDFEEIPAEDKSQENVTDMLSRKELVDKALETLNPKQRNIVQLVKIQGYSIAEASQQTGMSVSAVKVTIHRALTKMQKQMSKYK